MVRTLNQGLLIFLIAPKALERFRKSFYYPDGIKVHLILYPIAAKVPNLVSLKNC